MASARPPRGSSGALAAGSRLGRYRLESRLGAGGMGEVWKAVDVALGRWVAVKTLHARRESNPTEVERLRREARALASFDHPNIPHLFEILETEERLHLVLELIEGRSLAVRLLGGPMPESELVSVARQIAAALEAAHERKIVHRDLKAENVLVTDAGRVAVLDFGLVKSWDPDRSEDSLTEDGVVMGTSRSMSPEQARGLATDAASDLFAMGSLMYELATGRHPFQASTPLETMDRVVHHHPPGIRALRPELSCELERLISRLLEKDPDRRCSSAAQLRRSLELLADVERPTETCEVAPRRSAAVGRGRWRRRPIALAGVALGTAAVVASLMWRDWQPGVRVAVAPVGGPAGTVMAGFKAAASETLQQLVARSGSLRLAPLPEDAAVVDWSVPQLLRASGADALVRPGLSSEGEGLRVALEWWDASHATVPARRVVTTVADPEALLGPLVRAAGDLEPRLVTSLPPMPPTPSPQAFARLEQVDGSCARADTPVAAKACAERLLELAEEGCLRVNALSRAAAQALWLRRVTGNLDLVEACRLQLADAGCPEDCDPRLTLPWVRIERASGGSPDDIERRLRAGVFGEAPDGRSPTWLEEVIAAELAVARERPDLALRHLEIAIDLAPGVRSVEQELAELELIYGQAADAERWLDREVLVAGSTEDLCRLATAHRLQGNLAGAEATLLAADEERPPHPDVLLGLAELDELSGRRDQGLRRARSALELLDRDGWGPGGSGGLLRARALAFVGSCEEAVTALRPALVAPPDEAVAALAAAEVLHRCGDPTSAEVHLRTAARRGVADAWLPGR